LSISLRGVGHTYGSAQVLAELDLNLESGELLCVLGPSGSGKSTLLKLVAGLESLQAGTISFGTQEITPEHCPPPEARPIGLVFQEHALFPHLTVAQNVGFGLAHLSAQERESRVQSLLEQIELQDLAGRMPATLSGGQQQRVALARALAPQPAVLLLDEPFASVDVLLKTRLREEMRGILKTLGSTSILVTHDPEDALIVADRVAVIVAGKLVQIGTPRELWEDPGHPFVAEMFAKQQIIGGDLKDGIVHTAFGAFSDVALDDLQGESALLAIDPFAVQLVADENSPIAVTDIRFAGQYFQITLSNGAETLTVLAHEAPEMELNQPVAVSVAKHRVRAYNCE
jgi:iron(III) transport system ATP-binding protein